MKKLTEDIINQILFLEADEAKKILLKGYFPHSVISVTVDKQGNTVIEVDDERTEIKVY